MWKIKTHSGTANIIGVLPGPAPRRQTLWFRAWLVVLMGVGLPLLTPAQLPSLGDGVEISMMAERKLGDRIARELYRDPDHIDDPLLEEYVVSIWRRLLAGSKQRGEMSAELENAFAWTVFLSRDQSVNAFALPGGYMGVHLGLIAMVSSQDELASVLAHELSHITQRHIARLISRQSAQGPILLGAMILGALAAASNPQAATALIAGGQAVAVQGQLNFSRDMEREADRVGYSVLTDSGFMPQGFVSMFEKLQQANRFNDTGAFPYLRSHPLTTERIADMQARQQLLPVVVSKTQLQHVLLAARARALSQLGVDAQRGLMQRAAAQSATALPEQRAAALYSGVLAALTQRAYFQAELWHTELLKLTVRDPAAQRLSRLLGVELALAQGQPALALQQLGSDARSAARAELVFWSQATLALLRQQPEPEGALLISRLQSRVLSHPSDALAWQLLSSAYGVQGNTLRSVTAEAEMFAARLDDQGALNRYRAAQDKLRQMPQPDNIEASIIDTRVRQLAARIREQALER